VSNSQVNLNDGSVCKYANVGLYGHHLEYAIYTREDNSTYSRPFVWRLL